MLIKSRSDLVVLREKICDAYSKVNYVANVNLIGVVKRLP